MIKATLKYSSQDELIRDMAPLISKRGLFIRTRMTRPVGSEVHFEFKLADGSITYMGEGVVRKEIPFVGGPSSQASGMLISLRKINRPFKEVVDAALAKEAAPETEETSRAGEGSGAARQFIVESRAGDAQGFDLFGELDFDEGLDSLFAGIGKRVEPVVETSGLYDRPAIVSGVFERPVDEDQDFLDYVHFSDEAAVSEDGMDFDIRPPVSEPSPREAAQSTGQFEASEVLAAVERETVAFEQDVMAAAEALTSGMRRRIDVPLVTEDAQSQQAEASEARDSAEEGEVLHATSLLYGDAEERQSEEIFAIKNSPWQPYVQRAEAGSAADGSDSFVDGDALAGEDESLSATCLEAEAVEYPEPVFSGRAPVFASPTPTLLGMVPRVAESRELQAEASGTFPHMSREETPSELFEALRNEILGDVASHPAEESANAEAFQGGEGNQEGGVSEGDAVMAASLRPEPIHFAPTEELPALSGNRHGDDALDDLIKRSESAKPEVVAERIDVGELPRRKERKTFGEVPVDSPKKGLLGRLFGK